MPKSFFYLFFIAVFGVIATNLAVSEDIKWITFFVGIGPLILYHILLSNRGFLSSTETDSIYYFGFLITIVTLVSTAIFISRATETINLNSILFQFGLGLIATGYALFARLHLISKSSLADEKELNQVNQNLLGSMQKIVNEYENANYQIIAFVKTTESRLNEIESQTTNHFATIEKSFYEKLNSANLAFDEAIAKMTNESFAKTAETIEKATVSFSASISLIMEEVGRIQIEAGAISFSKAAKNLEKFTSALELSMLEATDKVRLISEGSGVVINDLMAAIKKIQEISEQVSIELEELTNVDRLLSSINASNAALESLSLTAGEATDSLSSLATKTSLAEAEVREKITGALTDSNFPAVISNAQASMKALTEAQDKLQVMINAYSDSLALALKTTKENKIA